MSPYTLLTKVQRRTQVPKVYALFIQADGHQRLCLNTAFSLDEALGKATKESAKAARNRPDNWALIAHLSVELETLITKFTDFQVDEVKKVGDDKSVKNKLMNRIVRSKDRDLFLKNQHLFTAEETKLIEEKLQWPMNVMTARKKLV